MKAFFSFLTICAFSLSISTTSFATETTKEKSKTEAACCQKSKTASCDKDKKEACAKGEGCCNAPKKDKGQESSTDKKSNKKKKK